MRHTNLLLALTIGTLAPSFSLAQAPATPTSSPLPNKGEIGLEGSIVSVDSAHHSAVLLATRFFLSTGKSGSITPPKTKVLNWDKATFPAGSVQQFKVGTTVRIIGKDLGSGQALPARLITLVNASGPTGTAPTRVTPPTTNKPTGTKPLPDFPVEGEDKGWKFRATDAGFMPSDSPLLDPKTRQGNQLQKWQSPSFVVQLESTNPKGVAMSWNDWYQDEVVEGNAHRELTLNARFVSPAGVAYGARVGGNANIDISCPAVNPQWPFVWLELFGRDPKAPDGLSGQVADGKFQQSATLDFAAPTSENPIELNKTISGKLGTQIQVKTVQLKHEGQGGNLDFTFSTIAQPGEEVSDVNGPYMVDDKDKRLSFGGGGSSQGDDYTYTVNLPTLPTDAIWHARFDVTTLQRSRAVAAHRFLARLKIPITSKEARPPYAQFHDVTRFVSEPNALEALVEDDGPILKPWWSGRLWIHNTGPDATRFWAIHKSHIFTPNGKELNSDVENNRDISYWHRDGSPASAQDNSQRFTVHFDAGLPRPQSLKGRFELQNIQALDYSFTIKTAIPKPGQTVQMDEDVKTDTNAPFVLRAIRYYQSQKELQQVQNQFGVQQSGLALAFEVAPLLPGAQPSLFSSTNAAYDDVMRPLTSRWGLRWVHRDALNVGHNVNWTAFLPVPAPDAKTVEITTETQELTTPTQTTTIEIPNIPIPAEAK